MKQVAQQPSEPLMEVGATSLTAPESGWLSSGEKLRPEFQLLLGICQKRPSFGNRNEYNLPWLRDVVL